MTTKIKLFLTDVDGVMTDAGMYYTESGDEFKKFNTHDGMAFNLLARSWNKNWNHYNGNYKNCRTKSKKTKSGLFISGAGFTGKLEAASEICEKENISLMEVAYIGDDINCIELLQAVGFAACPSNSTKNVKAIQRYHSFKKGGW